MGAFDVNRPGGSLGHIASNSRSRRLISSARVSSHRSMRTADASPALDRRSVWRSWKWPLIPTYTPFGVTLTDGATSTAMNPGSSASSRWTSTAITRIPTRLPSGRFFQAPLSNNGSRNPFGRKKSPKACQDSSDEVRKCVSELIPRASTGVSGKSSNTPLTRSRRSKSRPSSTVEKTACSWVPCTRSQSATNTVSWGDTTSGCGDSSPSAYVARFSGDEMLFR
jgi:hypothetical protein